MGRLLDLDYDFGNPRILYCALGGPATTSTRNKVNKFVSTLKAPPLTSLQWAPVSDKKMRQSKVWEFMGVLFVVDAATGRRCPYDDILLHCKLCFDEQVGAGKDGHMSKIYCAKQSTASGNHMTHASQKHKREYQREAASSGKLTAWLNKSDDTAQSASNQFEFNRDLALLVCRDLLPFHAVEKRGFRTFCSKNTTFSSPTAKTVATTALIDVYSGVKTKVKGLLAETHAATLMMDGWTDKYHCHPYFAVRVGWIHDWTFKVVTLSMQPVENHTAQNLSRCVKEVVSEFMPHHKRMLIFNTTDGAANMKLLSKVLGHDRIDCTAHCLHLLLTVDSCDKIPELTAMLQKCKDVINALHFKGHLITSMQDISKDMEMFDRVNALIETLAEDECSPVVVPDSEDCSDDERETDNNSRSSFPVPSASHATSSGHQTLKMLVCTRWNSTLMMIESILDLQCCANEALKKIGKFDLCVTEDDICILKELRAFLGHFKPLTMLVSECNPNLSLLPLLRTRIIKACEQSFDEFGQCTDSPAVIRLKKLVLSAIDKRIKVNQLVKLACCFDPPVRNAVLSSTECSKLLNDAYQSLVKENSTVRHVFTAAKMSNVKETKSREYEEEEELDLEVSAKKLRTSLLQVTSLH